ncbi:adenosylcobinamide-GDP ribazoletransferase [Chloroflexota bacterium]
MGFFIALQFLTIIPSPFHRAPKPGELGKAIIFFPVIGLMIGGVLYGFDYGLGLVLPAELVSALTLALAVLLTGALHMDGFMDTCDGLAGSTPEQRMRIMSDTRVGAFGVAGGIVILIVKYAALVSLPAGVRMATLLLFPIMGRWVMVYLLARFPYAKNEGIGFLFSQQATCLKLIIVSALVLAPLLLLMWWQGVILLAIVWLVAMMIGLFLKSRLRGLTGDSYGAANEIIETISIIIIPLVMNI